MTTQEVALPQLRRRAPGWFERWVGHDVYRTLKGLITNPISVIGLVLLAFFIFVAAAAPILAPYPPGTSPSRIPRDGFGAVPKPPGTEWKTRQPPLPFWWKAVTGKDKWVHLMGTASGQWDIYYGVVWGTRTALLAGLIITACGFIIGCVIGAVSAFYGGWVDMVLMRITDLFQAFPFLLTAMTLSAVLTPKLGKGLLPPAIALIMFSWMGFARLLRSDILSLREREYVLAARVIGVQDTRIMFRHILPNAIFPTLVLASMRIGSYAITFAGLSFLGIGAEVGYPDWGQLLSFARNWMTQLGDYWYIVVFPGVALVLFVLSWNLVGDALRDVLDPRLQGSR
ncbi:MAG TPA: ABC transporter permease [Anaerolineae bacterium]|nr:ABC transporter permease [Anaerolineae bacterium]HQK14861.1 ABC transporter permease [Anaerolineae bacterium]